MARSCANFGMTSSGSVFTALLSPLRLKDYRHGAAQGSAEQKPNQDRLKDGESRENSGLQGGGEKEGKEGHQPVS